MRLFPSEAFHSSELVSFLLACDRRLLCHGQDDIAAKDLIAGLEEVVVKSNSTR